MKLRELLADTEVAEIAGDGEVEIAGLAYDSRRVEPGTLFFCVPGQRSDGHEFGERAVRGGASALVVERPLDLPVTQVRVADARAAMASAAARFWLLPGVIAVQTMAIGLPLPTLLWEVVWLVLLVAERPLREAENRNAKGQIRARDQAGLQPEHAGQGAIQRARGGEIEV